MDMVILDGRIISHETLSRSGKGWRLDYRDGAVWLILRAPRSLGDKALLKRVRKTLASLGIEASIISALAGHSLFDGKLKKALYVELKLLAVE